MILGSHVVVYSTNAEADQTFLRSVSVRPHERTHPERTTSRSEEGCRSGALTVGTIQSTLDS